MTIAIKAKKARPSNSSRAQPAPSRWGRVAARGVIAGTSRALPFSSSGDNGFTRSSHDLLFRCVGIELGRDPATAHHDDPVCDAEALGNFGGREHHGAAAGRLLGEQAEDFG